MSHVKAIEITDRLLQMLGKLKWASPKSRQAARSLLSSIEVANTQEASLSLFDYDGGVMLKWEHYDIFCDIDPDGQFGLYCVSPPDEAPDEDGFVPIAPSHFDSSVKALEALRALMTENGTDTQLQAASSTK